MLAAVDGVTARSQGSFARFNLDVSHLQALSPQLTLFARVSAQRAQGNLDSSEKFVLGGAYGVRGWPSGEATGDEGALGQFEVRYRVNGFEPFAFYDAGVVRFNRQPWVAGQNRRDIDSYGVGVRWAGGAWNADATLAWRGKGGAPVSDPNVGEPMLWVNLSYRF